MNGRLAGRSVVVTGGASGLGRAIASRFADEGARSSSAISARRRAKVAIRSPRCSASAASFLDADASSAADVDLLVRTAVERCGRLDVMVCNAGVSGRWSKGLLETTEEDWDTIMAVNLRGVFLGTSAPSRRWSSRSRSARCAAAS